MSTGVGLIRVLKWVQTRKVTNGRAQKNHIFTPKESRRTCWSLRACPGNSTSDQTQGFRKTDATACYPERAIIVRPVQSLATKLIPSEPGAEIKHVFTDAATTYGAGGYIGNRWFAYQWLDSIKNNRNEFDIQWMELFPIAVASKLWGSEWSYHHVCFYTDNEGIVLAWKGCCRISPYLSKLMERLHLAANQNQYDFSISLIPARENRTADNISRGKFDLLPKALDLHRTPIPEEIIKDLIPDLTNYKRD